MNTRYAQAGEPPSQNRYMSSPEYAELRGVNAVYVKEKVAITPDPGKRKLLWFLQALSLAEGGLKTVAADLLKRFPGPVRNGHDAKDWNGAGEDGGQGGCNGDISGDWFGRRSRTGRRDGGRSPQTSAGGEHH